MNVPVQTAEKVVEAPKPAEPTPAPIQEPKAEDLIKRMGTKKDSSPAPASDEDKPLYNSSDIEKIQDPQAKEIVKSLYKHFERGYNKKFESLAHERKTLEEERFRLQQMQSWSPERVAQELRNPAFVQAAQLYSQSVAPQNFTGSQEEWSSLSPQEQGAFRQLQGQVNQLVDLQSQQQIALADEKIKTQFPDYEPTKVDSFQKDILDGRVNQGQIRELIWKAINFEKSIEDAYRYGKEDRASELQSKMNASTSPSTTTTLQEDKPQMKPGEASSAYFRRLGQWNLSRMKLAGKS